MLNGDLGKNWWLIVLRGVLAIAFGVLAWLEPGITLKMLVILFGAYALADGIVSIIVAIAGIGGSSWGALLFRGIIGIAAGIFTLAMPRITGITLLLIIAAWAMVTGVFEIIAAIRLRKVVEGEWMLALAGIASVIVGIALALMPRAGALALVWLIGSYAILLGILLVGLGIRLYKWSHRGHPQTPQMAGSNAD